MVLHTNEPVNVRKKEKDGRGNNFKYNHKLSDLKIDFLIYSGTLCDCITNHVKQKTDDNHFITNTSFKKYIPTM